MEDHPNSTTGTDGLPGPSVALTPTPDSAVPVVPGDATRRSPRKKEPKPEPHSPIRGIRASPVVGGGWDVEYNWRVYRFLLDDGRTVDVSAITNDSYLASAILQWMEAKRICGVAEIAESHDE